MKCPWCCVLSFSVLCVCVCVCVCVCNCTFCTRQCSKPCDVSPISEKAGNLGLGFSPEPLSFPFSSGMLLTGANMCTHANTHTHTRRNTHVNTQIHLINTDKLQSVQTGSVASLSLPLKAFFFVLCLLKLKIFLQTLACICTHTHVHTLLLW